MFGYIITNQDELKVKEVKKYRAYYCGLCQSIKNRHGVFALATLTYDMTFLSILLSGLYDVETKSCTERCIAHPLKKHPLLTNEITNYAADMNLLMAYHNLIDNWTDDHSIPSKLEASLIHGHIKKISSEYPRQNNAILSYMKELSICEKYKEPNLDKAASLTGKFLGEIFAMKQDEWYDDLYQFGFFLGKFIYLCDAYEDVYEDEKKGHYNPFLCAGLSFEEIEEKSGEFLTMMAGEAARYFERLPILENINLLRNILYSGIFTKYEQTKTKRLDNKNKKEKTHDK